jgi:hypothetical protein
MLGLAAPILQPFIQCHGRVQRVHMITSLRNFGRARSVEAGLHSHPATAGFASPSGWACAAQRLKQQQQQRQVGWRCLAAQQLHAAGGVDSGSAAASVGLAIRPGEVHIWWLDPAKVILPVRQQVAMGQQAAGTRVVFQYPKAMRCLIRKVPTPQRPCAYTCSCCCPSLPGGQ